VAVGDSGTIMRYDGVRWYEMRSPTQKMLRAVSGSGPTDMYAVGEEGIILHFDGVEWSILPTPTDRLLLQLVFERTTDAIYVVGAGTVILRGNKG
jgi:photosystem II stability/assembly factor-like uncharacterized protein